ncbi:hypothetical protein BKA69DRAFT_547878 [Paraphysoderma sedebokerense]|nr:hypothetical protein BKA69DRAFT_547878 [Paraphysoderma sedebokerense]
MTSTNFGLSLFLYLAFLLSLTNAAPQQPLQPTDMTQECSKTLGDAVGVVLRSCALPVDQLKRNLTALPANPDDQIRLFVAASNTFCAANCSNDFAKATQEVESRCNTSNPPDENALWFFRHGLFGSRLICQKEGDQLCINKVIEQARQLKRLEIVLPLVMPLFTYSHMNAMIKIPSRDSHGWFEAGLSLMEDLIRLPGE